MIIYPPYEGVPAIRFVPDNFPFRHPVSAPRFSDLFGRHFFMAYVGSELDSEPA